MLTNPFFYVVVAICAVGLWMLLCQFFPMIGDVIDDIKNDIERNTKE